jgi:hypothetical protein
VEFASVSYQPKNSTKLAGLSCSTNQTSPSAHQMQLHNSSLIYYYEIETSFSPGKNIYVNEIHVCF